MTKQTRQSDQKHGEDAPQPERYKERLHPRHPSLATSEPYTGVGNPGPHPEAAGADLGGDTGDVSIAPGLVGASEGGMHGARKPPEASSISTPSDRGKIRGKRRKSA